jgi:CRISPR type III-B/RAMP module-associated protein Cmr5
MEELQKQTKVEKLQRQTRRQNIEQERGRIAWQDVREVKAQDVAARKEYRSIARGLNSMIQINGLGQTLAFLNAKGKGDPTKPHSLLAKHLTEWMRSVSGEEEDHHPHFAASNRAVLEGNDGLLGWITHPETSSADYRRATTECLAFGGWLRRFAEAELEEEKA